MVKRSRGFYWKLALTNLWNHRRVTVPYLLSAAGTILMFYALCALTLGLDEETMYGGTSVASMLSLGIFVMEKRHIAHIIFRETLVLAALSLVVGIGLGILFSGVMFLVLGALLGASVSFRFFVPALALQWTAVLFAAIFLLTMCYNILQVRLANPIQLLHGGEVGEKEPKAHWVLAVLGAVLLGAGYYLALTVQDPLSALLLFFVAVVLVILGTYLLFLTGITALLKLLKKNKGFYYKLNHFTERRGAGLHLHFVYGAAGDGVHHLLPVHQYERSHPGQIPPECGGHGPGGQPDHQRHGARRGGGGSRRPGADH